MSTPKSKKLWFTTWLLLFFLTLTSASTPASVSKEITSVTPSTENSLSPSAKLTTNAKVLDESTVSTVASPTNTGNSSDYFTTVKLEATGLADKTFKFNDSTTTGYSPSFSNPASTTDSVPISGTTTTETATVLMTNDERTATVMEASAEVETSAANGNSSLVPDLPSYPTEKAVTTAMLDTAVATGIAMDAPAELLTTVISETVATRLGVVTDSTAMADDPDAEADETAIDYVEIEAGTNSKGSDGEEDNEGGEGGGGGFLSKLFGGGGGGLFGGGGDEDSEGNLKCFVCESCPASTEKMRRETCIDFSALCMTKTYYTMRRGKLYYVRKSRFCGPSSCPPSSLMQRYECCSGDLCNKARPSALQPTNCYLPTLIAATLSMANLL